MAARRLATETCCCMCPTVFRPWCRKRQGLPTCSIKCARAMTGRAQRGYPMKSCLSALAQKRADEAAAVGQRFGSRLTPREVAIYRYGINVGIDREYRTQQASLRAGRSLDTRERA